MNWKKIMLGTFSFKRLFRSLILMYILITLLAHFYAEKLIFPYHQSSYDSGVSGLLMLKANDGTQIATRMWKANNEKALLVYFHGNYMDIGHLDEIAEFLNVKRYSVLAMDYRGYGLSEGEVNENNAYSDAQLVYDYALKRGYHSDEIIIFGQSIGAGIATDLAVDNDCKALVLVSPFVSTYQVMTKYPLIAFTKFNNLTKINKIDKPLLAVHGTADLLIPAWHSQKLIEKHQAISKRILIEGAGHNDMFSEENIEFINEIDSFVGL